MEFLSEVLLFQNTQTQLPSASLRSRRDNNNGTGMQMCDRPFREEWVEVVDSAERKNTHKRTLSGVDEKTATFVKQRRLSDYFRDFQGARRVV